MQRHLFGKGINFILHFPWYFGCCHRAHVANLKVIAICSQKNEMC